MTTDSAIRTPALAATAPPAASETSPLLGRGGDRPPSPYSSPSAAAAADDDDDEETANGHGHAATATADDGGGRPKVNMRALFPALAAVVFLVALDQTLTIATYGRIGSDLRALHSTGWVATSYFLTLTAFQPLYGKLSDVFGRKPCLLFSLAVFGLGSVGCGLAGDIVALCVARGVQGAGGGGLNSVVSILLTDLVSLRDRGLWQGYVNVVYATGVAAGAPLGGLLADSIGWRWAFIGQGPIALVAWIAVYLVLNIPKTDKKKVVADANGEAAEAGEEGEEEEEESWTVKVRRIDFPGAFTLVSAVFLLLFGLDNGSNRGWDKLVTIVPLALTPVVFCLFVLVEVKVAREPFAPGHVILDPNLLASYGANFFGVAAQMGVMFFVALFFQAAAGLSATSASLLFLPGTFAGLTGSLGGGMLMRASGRYWFLTICGYLALITGIVVMLLCSGAVTMSVVGVVLGLMAIALGIGSSLTSTLTAIIANASKDDMAVAVACSYLFRSLGTSIGISISTAVLQQTLRTALASRLADGGRAAEIEEGVRESLSYIATLEPEVAHIVRQCYAVATQFAYIPALVLAVLALVSASFIREKKLDGR